MDASKQRRGTPRLGTGSTIEAFSAELFATELLQIKCGRNCSVRVISGFLFNRFGKRGQTRKQAKCAET